MGALKLDPYTKEEIRNAELGRAIGAPARIVILRYLKENGIANGPILNDIIDLSSTTIHQHLSVLKQTKLIIGEYHEHDYYWKLNPESSYELSLIDWCLE